MAAGPASADVVVAARTIPAATVIAEADVAVRPGQGGAGALGDPAEAVGRETRVALYAGRPVRAADVGAPAVVERNAIITLVYRSGGLLITTEGRALDRAGPGDVIRVMNLSSRNTVTAVIAEDGAAHVAQLAPFSRRFACWPVVAAEPVRASASRPNCPRRCQGTEHQAMMTPALPLSILPPSQPAAIATASLWTGERGSLLGDRRAMQRGDILTVVIEIDDSAEISNSTDRSRSGEQEMTCRRAVRPARADQRAPAGRRLAQSRGRARLVLELLGRWVGQP